MIKSKNFGCHLLGPAIMRGLVAPDTASPLPDVELRRIARHLRDADLLKVWQMGPAALRQFREAYGEFDPCAAANDLQLPALRPEHV